MTSTMKLLPLLLLLLAAITAASAIDIPISHTPPTSTTSSPLTTLLSLANHDKTRITFLLSSKRTDVPIASGQQVLQSSSYILRASLGSPPQLLLLAFDTAADSSFLSSSSFSPSNSTTYTTIPCPSPSCPLFKGLPCAPDLSPLPPCTYTQPYGGDGTAFTAVLSQDSITLARDAIPSFLFGYVTAVTGNAANLPKQGLLGLGRGPTSLISQAGAIYQGVFSYCLPSFKSYYFSGSLRLGSIGQPARARFTPLLKNPHRPSLYYVNLTAVSVGRVQVAMPEGSFGFDPNTGSGTVIDSGTVITRFVGPAYAAIRDEFRRQVNASTGYSSLGAFDTCFNADEAAGRVPKLTLHMSEGLDLALPMENTLIHSSATPLACLAMAAAPDNVNAVVNVIASLQQQNLRVVIDMVNGKVGFARELCN